MPVLSARNVSKSYGARTLFSNVSLTITRKEKVGLIGLNGAGKSTLLRLLSGVEAPDTGTIERRKGATLQVLEQDPKLNPELTARQIVASGLRVWTAARDRYAEVSDQLLAPSDSTETLLLEQAALAQEIDHNGGWHREHEVEDVLGKVGIRELDRAVGSMSGGERRRISLAQLLVARPHLAILDEPTNHLDAETIEWLETYFLEEYPGALLLVTHDRYVLDAVCDKTIELDRGELVEYRGGYGEYVEQKADRLAHADRAEQNRLNLLRREKAWLLRGAKARTTKQKARQQRAEELLRVAPLQAEQVATFGDLDFSAQRLGGTILNLLDVSIDISDKRLVDQLTLHLTPQSRVGIVGRSGIGKSTLLRAIVGEVPISGGKIERGARTSVVYFDQARSELSLDGTVLDNVLGLSGVDPTGAAVVEIGGQRMQVRSYLEHFLFDGHKLRQPVASLSGGEKARVALARVLLSNANLLLMDEPTNDLDVSTLAALEELLVSWAGALMVVSHDRWFLDRVATSILCFEDSGKLTHYAGNYQAYRARVAKETKERSDEPKQVREQTRAKSARPKPLSFHEQRELDGMLDRIETAEKQASDLEAKLANPETYSSANAKDELPKLQQALAATKAQVAELMARWEELESRRVSEK